MKNLNSCDVIVIIQSNKTSFITPMMTKILWLAMNLNNVPLAKNTILLRVETKSNNVEKNNFIFELGI